MLLLARVPMARREAAIGATTATIVRPWKNPEFVPRTGRHVAAYMYIYHVRMGSTSQTTLITACHSVAPGAVVSHSWCTSSQEGRLTTIVTRREKSSFYEIAPERGIGPPQAAWRGAVEHPSGGPSRASRGGDTRRMCDTSGWSWRWPGWCLETPGVGCEALTRARHGCGGPAGCPWA